MSRTLKPFSIWWYTLLVIAHVAILLLALRALLPDLWAHQVALGWVAFVLTFLCMHLYIAFFEWFFHRYALHAIFCRWTMKLAEKHRLHHSLTPVRLRRGRDGTVESRFPIMEPAQYEAQAFPWWSLLGFWAFFTPFIVGFQLLLPAAPLIFGGFAAVAWSLTCYEVFHAVEHRPNEWWIPLLTHRRFGTVWRKIYGFHHMHHANPACNEAISGFFGLPIPDMVLGTYHQPSESLLPTNASATRQDFVISPPPWFVQALDRWSRANERRIRQGLRQTEGA